MKKLLTLFLLLTGAYCSAQSVKFEEMLADSLMKNASVSFYVADADNGEVLYSHNPKVSLTPASNMKLVSSAAALELLGPNHVFKTQIGYTGELNINNGQLTGDIIIKGGGDPALGSKYFSNHYEDFAGHWIESVKNAGIKKVNGRIIADDSYFDFDPAAPRWLWEDLGASYGAGVFGLSIFDNTCSIKVRPAPDSINVEIIDITPGIAGYNLTNRLKTFGSEAKWYLYAAPYSSSGWLSGTIPARNEYIMKVSIPDPPLMAAQLLLQRMEKEKIKITGTPSTSRIENMTDIDRITYLAQTNSPELRSITEILNKESINLYADTFTKELGKQFRNSGTMADGIKVIMQFLGSAGVDTCGFFIEDGSGLSARNTVNAEGIAKLLIYMRSKGQYFNDYLFSLPDAGQNGTLAQFFTDTAFKANLKAKSGSMTRVRCYSGYFTAQSGKNMVFSILVNNFQGASANVVRHIEEILKEIILTE